ncbi:MAG: hypothetical protein RLZZ366_2335, partial [Pseudomonadota bacterium]
MVSGCREPINASSRDTPKFASVACQHNFLSLTGRVVDQANIIPPESEAQLTARLVTLEKQTRHQFVIVTAATLQGQPIEQYSYCLANHWQVGT